LLLAFLVSCGVLASQVKTVPEVHFVEWGIALHKFTYTPEGLLDCDDITYITLQHGYDPNMGIDTHFAHLAKTEGKRIVELESLDGQMQLFEVMPEKLQTAMLRATVEDIAKGELATEMDDLQKAWASGNADAIQENVLRETLGMPDDLGKDLYERIYNQRNRQMAEKIALLLGGSESCFVAVGAGHLTGPSGLAELLQAKGFTVRRL